VNIPAWLWIASITLLVGLLAVDVFIIGRRPHEPSMRECALAISFFITLAVIFGIGVWVFSGGRYAGEFFAGWLTEYSLSVDNLFVFVIIMAKFGVPRQFQQTALLVGIILALVMRGIFIALGAAAIQNFSWVFYLFGAFLIHLREHLVTGFIISILRDRNARLFRFDHKRILAFFNKARIVTIHRPVTRLHRQFCLIETSCHIVAMRNAGTVRDDQRRTVIRFRFDQCAQGLLVVCAHGNTRHINISV